VCAPPKIFIRVLLPAPFSPMRASTSPACKESETPSSASTPGNRLVIPLIRRRGTAVELTVVFRCPPRRPGGADTPHPAREDPDYFFSSASRCRNSATLSLLMTSTPVSISLFDGIFLSVSSGFVASSCIHLLER